MRTIAYAEDGRLLRLDSFCEYAGVVKATRDLDRLKRLHEVRLKQSTAITMVEILVEHFGLRMPELRFTGSTDRGRYFPRHYAEKTTGHGTDRWVVDRKVDGHNVIVLRPSHISVHLLIHELAHHWVHTKLDNIDGSHKADFTLRLDKLAEAAEGLI